MHKTDKEDENEKMEDVLCGIRYHCSDVSVKNVGERKRQEGVHGKLISSLLSWRANDRKSTRDRWRAVGE